MEGLELGKMTSSSYMMDPRSESTISKGGAGTIGSVTPGGKFGSIVKIGFPNNASGASPS